MTELLHRTRWPEFAALAAVTVGVLYTGALLVAITAAAPGTDFAVYRGAVQSMLAGGSLYDFELTGYTAEALPFTYPPFGGLLLAPIGLVPLEAGMLSWALVQLAGTVALALLLWRTPGGRRPAMVRWTGGSLACVGLLLSEPVRHGIAMGQVSLVLVLLVMADNLMVGRWRGVLTGVAGAIKLIPLVFLPYYLLTRQWRAARNLGVGFAGATTLAFVVLPADSLRYWSDLVLETGRVGEVGSRRNKSLLGLLAHGGLDGTTLLVVWVLLAAAVAGPALWRACRHHRREEESAAILVVGLLSTVVAPISWPHHLVWAPLAALFLLRSQARWGKWLGAAVLVLFALGASLMGYNSAAPGWLVYPEALIPLCLIALAVLGFPRRVPPPTAPMTASGAEPDAVSGAAAVRDAAP